MSLKRDYQKNYVCLDTVCTKPPLFHIDKIKTDHLDCNEDMIYRASRFQSIVIQSEHSDAFQNYNNKCYQQVYNLHERLISLLRAKFENDLKLNEEKLTKAEVLANLNKYKKIYNFDFNPENGKVNMVLKAKKEELANSRFVQQVKLMLSECVKRLSDYKLNGNMLEAKNFVGKAIEKPKIKQEEYNKVLISFPGTKIQVVNTCYLSNKIKYKISTQLNENDFLNFGLLKVKRIKEENKSVSPNDIIAFSTLKKGTLLGNHTTKLVKIDSFNVFYFEFDIEAEKMKVYTEGKEIDLIWKKDRESEEKCNYMFFIETSGIECTIERMFLFGNKFD